MARKIPKPEVTAAAQPAAAAAPPSAVEDLNVMHPESCLQMRGRVLTLREYTYIEGLNLQPQIKGLLADLYALFDRGSNPPPALLVRQVLARHAVTLQWLMAQSFTAYPEDPAELQAFAEQVAVNAKFVGGLDDIEGNALMEAWWGANRGFFTRRFVEFREVARLSASSSSTPP